MLNIVVVQVGNYCGRGADYIQRIFSSLEANLQNFNEPYRFWCITDDPRTCPEDVRAIPSDPGLKGWWNKLSLFKPGIFPRGDRALYFDLDTMVIGDMADIAGYKGPFAAGRDFYSNNHMNSSMMAWEVGNYDHIWNTWRNCGAPQWDKRGDQFWIETMLRDLPMDYFQDLYPAQFVSLKADCRALGGIPPGVRLVAFHGRPRPHEINFDLPTYFAAQAMCGIPLPTPTPTGAPHATLQ